MKQRKKPVENEQKVWAYTLQKKKSRCLVNTWLGAHLHRPWEECWFKHSTMPLSSDKSSWKVKTRKDPV